MNPQEGGDSCWAGRVPGPALYTSRPHGAWLDPANWQPPGPTPLPHTHQAYEDYK